MLLSVRPLCDVITLHSSNTMCGRTSIDDFPWFFSQGTACEFPLPGLIIPFSETIFYQATCSSWSRLGVWIPIAHVSRHSNPGIAGRNSEQFATEKDGRFTLNCDVGAKESRRSDGKMFGGWFGGFQPARHDGLPPVIIHEYRWDFP